ncbi:ATP-dependent DNA helicase [Gulosibacter sp. 10]|uniref:ATP-dependent helicase n=1 Tax=Gulosibacter sp. 10 TaxID=1255570 RepID=UPI00097EF62F|nr:ATP-dependent DNA helicase [Gulosibacter sp. 10]SJM56922.1 ATP-dependent DNA helicase SCO5184 [Gulosibacter sp. 10]
MTAVTHEQIARALDPGAERLHLPTTEQQEIIEAPLDPALVVAGAGSGKTHTMMLRIMWLIANRGVAPQQILGLTFTRKAAGELRERIERGLDGLRRAGLIEVDEFDVPQVSTYNSYANTIYAQYALLVGRDPDATLIDEPGAFSLMREVLLDHSHDLLSAREKVSLSHLTTTCLRVAREMREMWLGVEQVHEYADAVIGRIADLPGRPNADTRQPLARLPMLRLYAEVAEQYERRKRETGVVEFSDQVATASEIIALDPSIGAELREQSRVVILDEYQDTSVGQIRLLAGLFKGHSVMAVGDPKQSIYGWRGASAANMSRFHEDFDGLAAGRDFQLSISWRNDRRILEAANVVAAPLPEGRGTKTLDAREEAGEGVLESAYLLTDRDEAKRIAVWFRALLVDAEGGADRTAAVLVRNRSHMAPIAEALAEEGVPHQVLGLGGLFSTPEIVDLNALLRSAAEPQAGSELIRLLAGARFEVGLADITALSRLARASGGRDLDGERLQGERKRLERNDAKTEDRGESLAEALDAFRGARPGRFRELGVSEAGEARLREAARLLHEIRIRLTLPLPDLVDFAIRESRLDIEAIANPGRAVGRANLEAYLDAVVAYTRSNPSADVHEFLDWVALAEGDDSLAEITEAAARRGVVQLTTMHSAKGLEWHHVAVPQLSDSILPSTSGAKVWLESDALPYELRADGDDLPQFDWRHAETLDDIKAEFKPDGVRTLPLVGERPSFVEQKRAHLVAEARRLAYVAVTRARTHLLLTGSRWRGLNTKPLYPSEFLYEMAGELTLDSPEGREQFARIEGEPVVLRAALDAEDRKAIDAALPENPNSGGEPVEWPRPPMPPARLERLREAGRRILEINEEDAPEVSSYDPIIDLLFAEREADRQGEAAALPERFGASLLHDLLADPVAIARQRRRPMPQEPFRATLIGNLFHSWVESLYTEVGGGGTMLDGADLDDEDRADPGLERATAQDHEALERFKATFLASRFAANGRRPAAVELGINSPLGAHTVVGKLDAVYVDDESGEVEIVDWKTGRAPSTEAEREGRELQLMCYAHAYAESFDVPIERIRATLYYVSSDREISVRRMLSREALIEKLERAREEVEAAGS